MTNQTNKYQAYAIATQTVARTKQIVLLYEGIIRFLQQAKEAIAEGRIEDRYHLLIKASEVIGGLQACLDFENGGNIAKVLYNFYASIDGRIFSIHRTNSADTCDMLIAELKQMRDVWNEIDESTSGSTVVKEPVATPPANPPAGAEGVTLSA